MADFRQLISGPNPVLIHFFDESYATSNRLDSMLESIAKEMGAKVRVLNISLDKNLVLARIMQINRVPTLMIYMEENLLWRQSGITTKANIMKVLNSLNQSVLLFLFIG